MSRNRKKRRQYPTRSSAPRAEDPWYKRHWVIVYGIAAVLMFVLLDGPQALRNSRVLPSEVEKTISAYWSWVKEDSEWTGKWTAHPEGYVDIKDMHLSDVDLEIFIWATEGRIGGTIATKALCKEFPMFNYILLEGSVFDDTANVTAWDIIGGHHVEVARLSLDRNGYLMTVNPTEGQTELFPSNALLARDPSAPSDELNPDHTFCAVEKAEFLKRVRQPTEANNAFKQTLLRPTNNR